MITVLFFFANDRRPLFENTLECLDRVKLYDQCEKIVCSDGPTDFLRDGYKILEIPRPGRDYSWAEVWDLGVKAASYETIWYLDCDRFVPVNYLIEAKQLLAPKQWVYPKNTLRLKHRLNVDLLKKVQDGNAVHLIGEVELRVDNPPSRTHSQPGKNPFSGNTLFNKQEFLESGGLDRNFEGYGYADIDYYMKMHQLGWKFAPAPLDEYHQWHPHAAATERDKKMMYYNGLLYCNNWNLQPHEMLRQNCLGHHIHNIKPKTRFAKSKYDRVIKLL